MTPRDIANVVAFAADHAGFPLKKELAAEAAGKGLRVLDLGTDGPDSVDYPTFGDAMARALLAGRAARGVLICGTGIGIGIAANRHRGIRAAVCHNAETARLARAHNDANVLVLGARIIDPVVARDCFRTFLETDFEGGRHERRVSMLD